MSNMKTASVREVQHHLSEVLSWVERGEEVLVFRRNKMVARLLPPHPSSAESPDFVARARSVWGRKPRGKRLSEIAAAARGNR
jgi:antitoxin (DNA-binding transcriptional repressor) of toxin-antitoxin stability system